jgi:hypothetical protein
MELWMASESQGDIFYQLRDARLPIVKEINSIITKKNYSIDLDNISIIIILRKDEDFEELFLICREENDMDFRLRLDFDKFMNGSIKLREKMIFSLIWRTLAILKRNGFDNESFKELTRDIAIVAREHSWI